MKIDYSNRSSGKSTRMLQLLILDERRVLLTFSTKERDRLRKICDERDYRISHDRILHWEEYKRPHGEFARMSKILVDNADYILEQVIGDYIEHASITNEKIELRKTIQ